MTIVDYISDNIPFARPTDKVRDILQMMDEVKIANIPIVDNDKLVGWLSENILLDANERSLVGSLAISDEIPSVQSWQPIAAIMEVMQTNSISLVPVVDNDGKYLGCVTIQKVIEAMSILIGANVNGSTIVVDVKTIDYSLTRIVNIVEENGAKIYSITTNSETQTDNIEVYLRLNVENNESIVVALERYGYQVRTLDAQIPDDSILIRNYNSLMQYLNIEN